MCILIVSLALGPLCAAGRRGSHEIAAELRFEACRGCAWRRETSCNLGSGAVQLGRRSGGGAAVMMVCCW